MPFVDVTGAPTEPPRRGDKIKRRVGTTGNKWVSGVVTSVGVFPDGLRWGFFSGLWAGWYFSKLYLDIDDVVVLERSADMRKE